MHRWTRGSVRFCLVYDVAGRKTSLKDIGWLMFCALMIPVNVTLTLIRYYTHNTNEFYW